MAVYKSRFKGSQIDNAVSVANANLNRGTAETPIYYDSEGFGQAIEKDSTVTASSTKPLTSGGAYDGLEAVVDYSDIQYENFNGEFTKVGNVSIVDGVASGFSSGNYLRTPSINFTKPWEITTNFKVNAAGQGCVWYIENGGWYNNVYVGDLNNLLVGFKLSDDSEKNLKISYSREVNVYYTYVVGWTGTTYYVKFYDNNGTLLEEHSIDSTLTLKNVTNSYVQLGYLVAGGYVLNGSIDLNYFSITVDGKVVYTPYPQPTLPPSQNAAKQFIDSTAATKQDKMYGGYGIDVNGATVFVSDDVFREDEEARLHADLKVDHFGDMSVGNDSDVLELMNEAKHSTFDLSKFTKVGSPNITNDGIASGFSSSNYLQCLVDFATADSWEICGQFTTPSSNFGTTIIGSTPGVGPLYFYTVSDNILVLGLTSNSSADFNILLKTNTISANTTYWYKIIFTGTQYQLKLSTDGINYTDAWTPVNSTTKIYSGVTGLFIGSRTQSPFNGSIDLKQFSITVDGVPVFSGNKTGIDVLKPDNYTVVGSPTITNDGMLSNCGNGKYIQLPVTIGQHPFEVTCRFKLMGSEQAIIGMVGEGYTAFLKQLSNGHLVSTAFLSDDSGVGLNINTSSYIGQYISCVYEFSGTQYKLSAYTDNGALITSATKDTTLYLKNISNTIRLGVLADNTPTVSTSTGSIDLNAFKVYVDGDLVYQPCLKIPYTLTKDGKKIVDYSYRSRVEDEYTQAGFTPYYSLQDVNKGNYTVIGSPTISSDWVASGFSGRNYAKTSIFDINGNSSIKYQLLCKLPNQASSGTEDLLCSDIAYGGIMYNRLFLNANNTITLYAYDSSSAGNVNSSALTSYLNQYIHITCEISKNKRILTIKDINNNVIFENSSTNALNWSGSRTYVYAIGSYPTSNGFSGSIDLKDFKIYVDGNLTYEAVIPPNYTLATVEANDIVEEYLSGSTVYTQRADLFLEQQGTVTSGATVSFPKAFIDTNYALTIPYSAKTTTGFTAAADGDWLAEGNASI